MHTLSFSNWLVASGHPLWPNRPNIVVMVAHWWHTFCVHGEIKKMYQYFMGANTQSTCNHSVPIPMHHWSLLKFLDFLSETNVSNLDNTPESSLSISPCCVCCNCWAWFSWSQWMEKLGFNRIMRRLTTVFLTTVNMEVNIRTVVRFGQGLVCSNIWNLPEKRDLCKQIVVITCMPWYNVVIILLDFIKTQVQNVCRICEFISYWSWNFSYLFIS